MSHLWNFEDVEILSGQASPYVPRLPAKYTSVQAAVFDLNAGALYVECGYCIVRSRIPACECLLFQRGRRVDAIVACASVGFPPSSSETLHERLLPPSLPSVAMRTMRFLDAVHLEPKDNALVGASPVSSLAIDSSKVGVKTVVALDRDPEWALSESPWWTNEDEDEVICQETEEELRRCEVAWPLWLFRLLIAIPLVMSVVFFSVFVHDLWYVVFVGNPTHAVHPCFDWNVPDDNPNSTFASYILSRKPLWGGMVVEFCSRKGQGEACAHELSPTVVWIYMTFLPLMWMLTVAFATRARKVCGRGNRMMMVVQQLLDGRDDAEDTELVARLCCVRRFLAKVRWTKVRHAVYLLGLHAMALACDWYLGCSVAWLALDQAMWLGFCPNLTHVRPVVVYGVHLSQAMVDDYMYMLRNARRWKRDHVPPRLSWLHVARRHRELELTMSDLWMDINLLALFPALPVIGFGLLRAIGDPSQWGKWTWVGWLIVGGWMEVCILNPIAKVPSMFNTSAAFKSRIRERSKAGSHSIHSLVRSYCVEDPPRDAQEQEDYGICLHFVSTRRVKVFVGIPGVLMCGIDRHLVSQLFWNVSLKLPAFMTGLGCAHHLLMNS
uniref:Uncharacterized protein n=1 Tax=Noctiluca scintillans TaxID=2966 RepID=A0A7S1A761_NOCSC